MMWMTMWMIGTENGLSMSLYTFTETTSSLWVVSDKMLAQRSCLG